MEGKFQGINDWLAAGYATGGQVGARPCVKARSRIAAG